MTTYPLLRLEADGLENLLVDDSVGFYGQSLNLGYSVTRVSAFDAPDADGTIDTTSLIGARNVTLKVAVYPQVDLFTIRNRLRSFTAARLRPYLYVTQDATAPEQRVQLRRSQYSDVFGDGEIRPASPNDPVAAMVIVQWVAPLGILESAVEHSALVHAGGGAIAGRTYPLTFPRVYPASAPDGTGTVVNAGTTDAYPLLRLYGPSTEAVIDNITQDRSLAFESLTVAAGNFIEIDTRAKTILLNGDPASSLYDKLAYPDSSWWTLSPGENVIRYHPATYTVSTSVAEIVWRDSWL